MAEPEPTIPKYVTVVPGTPKLHICQMCGQPASETRPFGPHFESICEDCSKLDPELTDRRWRGIPDPQPDPMAETG